MGRGPSIRNKGTFGKTTVPSSIAHSVTSLVFKLRRYSKNSGSVVGGKTVRRYAISGIIR